MRARYVAGITPVSPGDCQGLYCCRELNDDDLDLRIIPREEDVGSMPFHDAISPTSQLDLG